MQLVDLPRGLGECRHFPTLPVPIGDRITACSGDAPQPRGFVAGLGQADECGRPDGRELFYRKNRTMTWWCRLPREPTFQRLDHLMNSFDDSRRINLAGGDPRTGRGTFTPMVTGF